MAIPPLPAIHARLFNPMLRLELVWLLAGFVALRCMSDSTLRLGHQPVDPNLRDLVLPLLSVAGEYVNGRWCTITMREVVPMALIRTIVETLAFEGRLNATVLLVAHCKPSC